MFAKSKRTRLFAVLTIALVAILAAGSFMFLNPHGSNNTSHAAASAKILGDGIGQAKFTSISSGVSTKAIKAMTNTIPHWTSSFSYDGTVYPYTMVGSDPAVGSVTTQIPTAMIPLTFDFSNGVALDGAKKVKLTLQSPLFQKADFTSGHTQYADAIQRAEFWNYVSTTSKNYHVLLKQPTILPTISFNVPAAKGQEIAGKNSGAPIGLIDADWFQNHVQPLLPKLGISGQVLTIFATYNIFLYQGTTTNCCILGYHSAFQARDAHGLPQFYTYMFASYTDPGIFKSAGIQDIHALSHELSEWMNDPFVNNIVPYWTIASEPQYGCSNYLETGDPLVGVAIEVNGYHPQDEAFLPWFSRVSPSTSINGQYSYLGTLTKVSDPCTPSNSKKD